MLIDTHAHLNFAAYDKDRDEVIKRSLDNNVWMFNIGTNFQTSKKAMEIVEKYSQGVYAAIGLHPINLDTGLVKIRFDELEGSYFEKEFDYEKYKELAQSEKVKAIGEIGLDYYWKPKTTRKKELFKQKQKELLLEELKLAKDLNLPVIFHCRMAHQDLIEFLKERGEIRPIKAVAHGFVGNLDELKAYLNFGFYIGFNGIIFKNIEGIKVAETSSHLPPRATSSRSVFEENIKQTPLERILIETDCPYLIPPQVEKERNEPIFVKYIAQKIAEIKKLKVEKVAEITSQNARELFKI